MSSRAPRPTRAPAEVHFQSSSAPECYRVLIVEDEALLAMEAETALLEAGYEVVGVANRCRTAIELAAFEHPDLIVMDVRLAGERDGVDAAVIIRENYDIPSLFVTAQPQSELAPRAEAANPVGWLKKPFQIEQLIQTIKAALQRV